MTRSPVFYDIEASGLDGFAIEIGWAQVDAISGAITSESHLIKPLRDWLDGGQWDDNAEEMHGISLERLEEEGAFVWAVAKWINEALSGRELFSDSPRDAAWLKQIFDGAGSDRNCHVRNLSADVLIKRLASEKGLEIEACEEALRRADQLEPRQHRAEADARHLTAIWKMVAGAAAG